MERRAAVSGISDQLPPVPTEGASFTPVSIGRDRLLTGVRIGLLTGQVMDLSTTTYGIESGVVKEANPFLMWAADQPMLLTSVKLGGAAGLDWSLRKLAKNGNQRWPSYWALRSRLPT